jgi:hypothetical protein
MIKHATASTFRATRWLAIRFAKLLHGEAQ